MKHFILFIFSILSICVFSQTATVKGTVKQKGAEETLPGAYIKLSKDFITFSDENGNYVFKNVPYGTYEMLVASEDLDTLFTYIKVNASVVVYDPKLAGSIEIEEIKVTANLVTDRQTPVPLTKISAERIAQELGSRDLPMLLNATPGVFATQSGGGDGDSRVVVRGFDQRNIGVLIDGVPVNDMENGQVYWSNWFGLDAITSQVQVQRGLGVTKLSMPSVGGSMNIVTGGIGGRKGFTFKQEYGTALFLRSSLTYNSGLTKKGWGVTASGSYKRGNGWVDGTWTEGWFYYAKVQKKFKKHLVSFSAFGAPQKHGQRQGNAAQTVYYWDTLMAQNLGYNGVTTGFKNVGPQFSENWGMTVNERGDSIVKNDRYNFYHKPQLTLKDFWTVNNKLSISNIAYVSIGNGGGTRLTNTSGIKYKESGQIDWAKIIKDNQVNSLFNTPTIDPLYSPTELKANQVQVASMNNHFWAGYLGQMNYKHSDTWTYSAGLDYRFYQGKHYQEIIDMLGGDYYINTKDQNAASPMKRLGDKIALQNFNKDRDGLVNWLGVFGSAEYATRRWSVFVNVSGVANAYKGIDYFDKKEVVLEDTTLSLGYGETIDYNGKTYTQADARYKQTEWKVIPGATIKTGAGYKLNEFSNVFVNLGYLSRTPQFSNVIDNNTNEFFFEIKNEIISAFELGYAFTKKKFGMNINTYFTHWQNRPFPFGVAIPDPQDPTQNVYVNINGMDAIHLGGEIDLAYNITKQLSAEGMFSVGDWKWNSSETVRVEEFDLDYTFDAKGVHVGDAAQTMVNLGLKYEPFKNLYFKAQFQFFDKYYASFDPFSLQGANAGKESWKLPSYYMVNFFAGYSRKINKVNLFFNGNITNLTNNSYIADARNNGTDGPDTFDVNSATVLFGQGFRFNLSMGINF